MPPTKEQVIRISATSPHGTLNPPSWHDFGPCIAPIKEQVIRINATAGDVQGWTEAALMSDASAAVPLWGVRGWAEATLMSAASATAFPGNVAHPHIFPVTKATPIPADSREGAAATPMG